MHIGLQTERYPHYPESSRDRAPEMISLSSVVTLAWRVRLNVRVSLSSISAEFLVEFSIACIAPYVGHRSSVYVFSSYYCVGDMHANCHTVSGVKTGQLQLPRVQS